MYRFPEGLFTEVRIEKTEIIMNQIKERAKVI